MTKEAASLGVRVLSPYSLQTVVQLHGFEQVVLLGPQAAAHSLTDCSDLAAFGLDGVLGIVGVLDQIVALPGQQQGSVQHLLWTSVGRWLMSPSVFIQTFLQYSPHQLHLDHLFVTLPVFCSCRG